MERLSDKPMDCLVEARELRKWFDEQVVLDGLDFCLKEKETVVILGKSGTGKSVFLQNIIGLIQPNEGELKVLGIDLMKLDEDENDELLTEVRRNVGFLFQGGALYDSMTVEENLRFPLLRQPEKPSKSEMARMIDEMLESVGLLEAKKKKPSDISGGMQKRIALARTLILKPRIMLYDEPTTGLDPATSREISLLIKEQQQRHGISGIVITHDMPCAKITADRILVLRDGQFSVEGSYDELAKHEDEWVRGFFTN